jgi:hypothetical protein
MFTDDSPERDIDIYDSEGLPAAALEYEENTSNFSKSEANTNRSNPTENRKPSRKPRREVWWLSLDLGATNKSLKSVGRCFEDRLNWSLLSSSNSLLRHVRSPKDDNFRWDLHQCPGYLREEITLTCDLSKSAIVSHAFPGPSERCSICHQLVQYTNSDCNDTNDSLSLSSTEGSVTFNHSAPDSPDPEGGIDPFTPNIGAKSSDAYSVMEHEHLLVGRFPPASIYISYILSPSNFQMSTRHDLPLFSLRSISNSNHGMGPGSRLGQCQGSTHDSESYHYHRETSLAGRRRSCGSDHMPHENCGSDHLPVTRTYENRETKQLVLAW